jgi:UrcA family protein
MKSEYSKTRYALLAGAALFSAGAWALPPVGDAVLRRSETVKYLPSAAATPEGAARLYGKLRRAAAEVCSNPSGTGHFDSQTSLKTCMDEALEVAVLKIGIPTVTAQHRPVEASPMGAAVAKR